ncbi:MAG: ATP-binding cassette domain-containing protein [Pseudomonadota bacterium]
MTHRIEMKGVQKAFGANEVLRGVDLSVAKGESLVVIGGSGTGKSVTIKTIIGLIEPDAGDILIDGASILGARGSSRDVLLSRFGMLFQGGALFDSMPVWRNIAFRLLQGRGRLSNADARDLAVEKLRRVGLKAEVADLFPAELSGGMQKRVGLARAIAAEPEIVFFDEPTAGLDPIMATVINQLIRELVTELGATAITITHDMRSVVEIADQVCMLHDGKVQWHGPVAEIEASGNAHLNQFIHGLEEGPIEAVR